MSKSFYLNGRWGTSDQTEDVKNPWSGQRIAEVALADASQIEDAIAGSWEAFHRAGHGPSLARASLLQSLAGGIARRRADFISTIIAEAGKPRDFAEVEVERAIISFEQAAGEVMQADGHLLPMEATSPGKSHFGLVRRFPLGVILGITPFNFPLNLVAHKVAPALAAGNAILLKPALKTPLTALLLAEVAHEAGIEPGLFNVVPFRHELLPPLLNDERIKMLSFTGSAEIGWKLKGQAVKMKVALELGGNAAVIVEPDSDWRSAVAKIAQGAFGYAGQSCISVQRILVHDSIYGEFRGALQQYVIDHIKTGDPSEKGIAVGPMINSAARDKVVKWLQQAEAAGAKFLTPLMTEGESVLHPVLLEDVNSTATISCEEAFAPVAILARYESLEQALQMVNASRYGLQAGIFTSRIDVAMQAFQTLEVGGVMVNQVPTFRVENMPYGGVKDSGFGREGIRYAMEEMSELRSLILNLG